MIVMPWGAGDSHPILTSWTLYVYIIGYSNDTMSERMDTRFNMDIVSPKSHHSVRWLSGGL